MNAQDITIIIPAFNEERSIKAVLQEMMKRFPSSEIIVVNDGSTDKTSEIAKSTGVTVIDHNRNLGYGAALRTGTLKAQKEYVLFCDSDGQHTVTDVNRLIEECDNHDMVVGSRGQKSYVPHSRRPGKLILTKFANHLAGMDIPDVNSGLRMIRRNVLLKYIHLMPNGFSFSTTSTFAMLKSNRHIKWVPITVEKRIGTSTVRQWRHGPETMMLMLRLTILFEPLKVFIRAAMTLFLMTIVSFIIDVFSSGRLNVGDTTVFLGIATLMVFMFGLLCDQVSALRREIHE